MQVSLQFARKMALNQQGLLSSKPRFGRGKAAVLRALEHLGYVQIDAISVIQRAHHHTLWSRIPGYKPQYLLDLLAKDRSIFEYWSHAMSFLPIKDYRFALPVMEKVRQKGKHWYDVDHDIKQMVLRTIEDGGPKYARDFETPPLDSSIMWNWKPAKKALHELFMEGSITVVSRQGFHRKYDLWPRFRPENIDVNPPSYDQYLWHHIKTTCQAHGLATIPEIRYQKFFSAAELNQVIAEKVKAKQLVELHLKKHKAPYYALPETMEQQPSRVVKNLHFLSPFDNAVIQRKRLKALFGFDYQTEIYYPVDKRKYGYFSMPILYGTEFIGRMDPKAHREQKHLEIRNLAIEPDVTLDQNLVQKLRLKLMEFAHFNECDYFSISQAHPQHLMTTLNR